MNLPDRPVKGETSKAQPRRIIEGFFEKYCHPDWHGIDIGSGPDPLFVDNPHWKLWDRQDGDATYMEGVPDNTYDAVYASHILEDFTDPVTPLKHWLRILKPRGYMTVLVPHRDRYERRLNLPSEFNKAHKSFYLPDRDEPPCTKSFYRIFREACPGAELISLRVLELGWDYVPPEQHAHGEYSIEIICRK